MGGFEIHNDENRRLYMSIDRIIRRGEIYVANLDPVIGSEQGGVRPVLVIQNDVGNKFSPTVIVAALTSRSGKNRLATHVKLNLPILEHESIVLLEQLKTIDKKRLFEYIGQVTVEDMEKIEYALQVSLGLFDRNA
jgi:mRNA interferase MazF